MKSRREYLKEALMVIKLFASNYARDLLFYIDWQVYGVHSIFFECVMNSHPHVSFRFQDCSSSRTLSMILYSWKHIACSISIITKKEYSSSIFPLSSLSAALLHICSLSWYICSKMIHILFISLFFTIVSFTGGIHPSTLFGLICQQPLDKIWFSQSLALIRRSK